MIKNEYEFTFMMGEPTIGKGIVLKLKDGRIVRTSRVVDFMIWRTGDVVIYTLNSISELNTLKTFVKVKGNSFDIGKTLFSFVEFDKNTKKLQKSVDCYMGLEESLIFCHDVLSGKLPKLAAKEKAKGEQYPKAV